MHRLFSIIFFTLIVSAQALGNGNIDSLIKVLDQDIEDKGLYESRKRGRLAPLYNNAGMSDSDESKFFAVKELFAEYRNFSMDTTLMLAREGKRLARAMGNNKYEWEATLMEAEALKGLGRYYLALQTLDDLPSEAFDSLAIEIMYRRCAIYYSLTEVPMPYTDILAYRDTLACLRTKLISSEASPYSKAINRLEYMKEQGDYRGAVSFYEKIAATLPQDPDSVAILNFIVGEAYFKLGQEDLALEHLLKAAITDIRNSDRKYNALPLVAKILYNRGDLQHAYDYIICSLSDLRAANAQSRMYRVNDALPIITNAYNDYQKQANKTRQNAWIIVMAFTLLLITLIVVIIINNKRLKSDGSMLKVKNAELENQKDEALTHNRNLENTSRTMEEYIGQLFNLNSEYINIMHREHSTLMKTVKSGRMGDVEKALSTMNSPERLASFFAKFDKCFLDIFPQFVEHFNSYLQPQYRYELPPGQLNPELRIYALMRLGVTETGKIASFLHYTNQTVYNYRNRVKSRALYPEIDMFDTIKQF